jgi:tetratricopeptide (TPR) repeat protein
MKKVLLISIISSLLLRQSAPAALGPATNLLAFTHATVIDATGAPPQSNITVVITGDRISAIGRSADVSLPTNAVVVDATGKFLIPGLWDMHVHWNEKDSLPLFTANGVTGVRIMWGMALHHEWRTEIEQGSLKGPRLFIASTIVDGPEPLWPGSIIARNAAEGRQAVLQAKEEGADFVKVYSGLPREAYFAIADETRKQGMTFAGHVPTAVSAAEASAAGQTSIEHLTGVLAGCSSGEAGHLKSAEAILSQRATNPSVNIRRFMQSGDQLALENFDAEKAGALFASFKTNHTWQCPTLSVLHNIRYLDELSATNDPRMKYMPRSLQSFWTSGEDDRFKGRTPADIAAGKKIYAQELKIVGALQRAGVGILAGTDTGNPWCFPGFSLHDELSLLVQAGLTPMEALQTATRNPARFMGREKELGTIESGKLADLVLLDANPLEAIGNTRKIDAVVCGGRLFSKTALAEMLAGIESRVPNTKLFIAEALFKTVREKGAEAAIQQYHELKATQSDAYDFSEPQLNFLGYQLLGLKRTKDAIAILKLNAEAYPQSANVYDSLGEAYLTDGNRELAITNYETSLRLDAGNKGAAEKLKQLKSP